MRLFIQHLLSVSYTLATRLNADCKEDLLEVLILAGGIGTYLATTREDFTEEEVFTDKGRFSRRKKEGVCREDSMCKGMAM